MIVQPDTLLRWHRDLFRRYWRRKSRSRVKYGKPPLTEDVMVLIKQMAEVQISMNDERRRLAERLRGAASHPCY